MIIFDDGLYSYIFKHMCIYILYAPKIDLSIHVYIYMPTALPPLMPAVGMCHGRSWWEGWGRKMWKCLPVRKFVSGESIYIYTVCILSEIIRYIYIRIYIYIHSYYYIVSIITDILYTDLFI